MDIKYNVYYATSSTGPWTLANTTPIAHDLMGNEYTIGGLTRGTLYYILVVGGYIDDDDEFVPLMDQPIGPTTYGAQGVGAAPVAPIAAREYITRKLANGSLGHKVTVS